jgi:hypothetical protein
MKPEHIHTEADGEDRWEYRDCYVKHSTTDDGVYVGDNLRSADRRELAATSGIAPVRVIVDGITAASKCYTIHSKSEGRPCGIFGTRESDHPESGLVWMLGTDGITTISSTFARNSRHWLNELHSDYRLLYNVIDARNTVHINWLSWMQFDFVQDIPKYGIERRHFILFSHYV